MLKNFENKLFLACAALVLTFNGLLYTFAEETDEETTEAVTITDTVDYQCGYNVMQEASVVVDSYQTFLDDFFKLATPSSDQVEDAMKYYRFIESSIQRIYEKNLKVTANQTLDDSVTASTYCAYVRDQYLDFAKAMMQRQVIASSNSKRTFTMIDGLKVTNENLETFSSDFTEVFPGFFNQFNNALPCYARRCITK